MKFPSRQQPLDGLPGVSGTARVDRRTSAVVRRLRAVVVQGAGSTLTSGVDVSDHLDVQAHAMATLEGATA